MSMLLYVLGSLLVFAGISLGIGGVLYVPWLNFVQFTVARYLHLSFEVALVISTLTSSAILIVSGVLIQKRSEEIRLRQLGIE
jgi:hypothetical protein